MKGLKKIFLLLLTLSLVTGSLYSTGWAGDKWAKEDPVGQGWSAMDIIFARPWELLRESWGLPSSSSHSPLLFLLEGWTKRQICLFLNLFNSPSLGNSRMKICKTLELTREGLFEPVG